MPELPEVETVARSLETLVRASVFTHADLLRQSALHPSSLPLQVLENKRIRGLSRRGKLLVFSLADSNPAGSIPDSSIYSLVIHLRMTGRLFGQSANAEQGRHTRCVFHLQKPDGSPFQLFFDDSRTFGKILLATPDILASWPFWRDMGPEPFALSPQQFHSSLNGRRPMKTVLLDQTVLAGIGNIYADETLHAAGISPLRAACDLNQDESARLLESIKNILRDAIAKKGSSIRDYRDAEGRQGTFQKFFAVYGRGGQPCKRCGTILEKTRIAGRASVFCPGCQK